MSGTLEGLRERFIRPTDEVEEMNRIERARPKTRFPRSDGYYWIEWPADESQLDPETGKLHLEPCEVKGGELYRLHTRFPQREQMEIDGRYFKFYPLVKPEGHQ